MAGVLKNCYKYMKTWLTEELQGVVSQQRVLPSALVCSPPWHLILFFPRNLHSPLVKLFCPLPIAGLWVRILSMTCANTALAPASSSASAGKGQRAKPKLLLLPRGCFPDWLGGINQWPVGRGAVERSTECFSPSSVSPAPPITLYLA